MIEKPSRGNDLAGVGQTGRYHRSVRDGGAGGRVAVCPWRHRHGGAVSRVGVLNFASGAAGAAGAVTAWQLVQWGWWPPLSWLGCIAVFAGSDAGLWPRDRAAAGLARNRGESGGNAGVRADPAGAGRLSLAR